MLNRTKLPDDMDRVREAASDLLRAIGGFIWLGSNLDNIKHDPDQFRRYYEAALEDAVLAYEKATGEKR